MAKTTGPLLSLGASGQIGDTLVFGKWKGVGYARQKVIPSNPKSTEQTVTRNLFSWLQAVYKIAPALFIAPWSAYVQGKALTERNAFTKFNLGPMRGETDLDNFVGSPGALGGLPPTIDSVTPGSNQLTVACSAPASAPTGWTAYSVVAMAIRDQDPDSAVLYDITIGEDTSSPYSIDLTGLTASVLYQVRAWMKWTRPDGTTAYSPSVDSTGTPTA